MVEGEAAVSGEEGGCVECPYVAVVGFVRVAGFVGVVGFVSFVLEMNDGDGHFDGNYWWWFAWEHAILERDRVRWWGWWWYN